MRWQTELRQATTIPVKRYTLVDDSRQGIHKVLGHVLEVYTEVLGVVYVPLCFENYDSIVLLARDTLEAAQAALIAHITAARLENA